MSILEILHHPDPRLRIVAKPVTQFDAALKKLIADMFETMYAAPGVGLAATQVGVAQRVAVMDCSPDKTQPDPRVMINPEILSCEDLETVGEGCLSVPEMQDEVPRYRRLRLRALDASGKPYVLDAEDLLAQAIQHEVDHLDGKLYIDYLSALKRERITKKLKKAAKRT